MNNSIGLDVTDKHTWMAMAVIGIVMQGVKASPVPNWLIPILAFISGAIANCLIEGWTGMNAVGGVLLGASVVGLHQGVVQQPQEALKPPGQGGSTPGSTRVLGRVAILSLCFLIVTGCSTPGAAGPGAVGAIQNDLDRAHRTAAVVETSAQLGTYFAVKREPGARSYFEAAHVMLTTLVSNGQFEPSKLRQALSQLPVKEVRSEEAMMGIEAALTLYGAYFGEHVGRTLDANIYARPVLDALCGGIAKGLQGVATETRFKLGTLPASK